MHLFKILEKEYTPRDGYIDYIDSEIEGFMKTYKINPIITMCFETNKDITSAIQSDDAFTEDDATINIKNDISTLIMFHGYIVVLDDAIPYGDILIR